jgi:hypothetical protein
VERCERSLIAQATFHQPINPSTHQPINPSTHQPINPSTHQPINAINSCPQRWAGKTGFGRLSRKEISGALANQL